jgi:signal transduction histidine kinase
VNIILVSNDSDLYKLCREALCGTLDREYCLSWVGPEDAGTEADLYLWDFQPEAALPVNIRTGARHLFLVHRKDLATFREKIETPDANILLKPLTRATLAAFLGLEAPNPAEESHALRAERDEILQWLMQTNLRLQEYEQDRTTFLARAVHDFRTPLTALSGYCGLLLSEPLGPLNEGQRELLRRMQHSAKRLSRMASAMFQLSVGRHIKRLPDLRKAEIRESLDQALHEIAPFADDKNLIITSNLEAPRYALYFEPGQIEQVLINILDNACKFTPRGGSIDVRGYPYFWERRRTHAAIPPASERRTHSSAEPNAYRIDILDSGKPIPAEHLRSIFEEYTTYSGGKDRSGGGLGLAITQMIITEHDGTVWAENTDSGPRFSIVLPVYRRQPSNIEKTILQAV